MQKLTALSKVIYCNFEDEHRFSELDPPRDHFLTFFPEDSFSESIDLLEYSNTLNTRILEYSEYFEYSNTRILEYSNTRILEY